jgi:allantoin racemase
MPRALVVNPNTSASMTNDIERTAVRVFTPPWSYVVAGAPAGPESLESWRDYALAAVDALPLLDTHNDCDGVVLSCFGDPGLYGLKELAQVPVVGIAEASMSMALLVGGKFGILAGMDRAKPLMDSMVRTYGLEARYAGTESLSMRVLDFDRDRAATLDRLAATCSRLVGKGADVVLLGCAGLSGYQDELMSRVPILAIDPVEAGCRMLKAIVEGGLRTSRGGLYAKPAPQRMNDLERLYTPDMIHILKEWEK